MPLFPVSPVETATSWFQLILAWILIHGLKIALILAGMTALYFLSSMAIRRVAAAMTRTGEGEAEFERDARIVVIAGYLQPVCTTLIVVAGGLMILDELSVPTAPILTMGSALFAMVAIGFVASWSVLSNAFCSILLLIYQPFTLGHTVELLDAEVKGKIVNFNLIYTTLETPEGEHVQVPNSLFFQQAVRKSAGAGGASLDQQLLDKPQGP